MESQSSLPRRRNSKSFEISTRWAFWTAKTALTRSAPRSCLTMINTIRWTFPSSILKSSPLNKTRFWVECRTRHFSRPQVRPRQMTRTFFHPKLKETCTTKAWTLCPKRDLARKYPMHLTQSAWFLNTMLLTRFQPCIDHKKSMLRVVTPGIETP